MGLVAVFPGQGSQSVGMLAELAEGGPEVAETFSEASELLGYDLWHVIQNGPQERLNETLVTQPAMLTAGVATWRCWRREGGGVPVALAGHSLGEFSALVAADSLSFADAVIAVKDRATYMQDAVPIGQGGIAALLGLDDNTVEELCKKVSRDPATKLVCPVNYNAPGQVVVAGHSQAVDEVLSTAKAAGARRAVRLPMSVPVHCPLMHPATELFTATLAEIEFRKPQIPVLHNADLETHSDAADMRKALVAQLTNPVRWTQTIEGLKGRGGDTFVELGPGRVLHGLIRRIDKSLVNLAVYDAASLATAVADL